MFISSFDISLDFSNLEYLKQIDAVFKRNGFTTIIPKYNYSLAALLGEFLKNNIDNAVWIKLFVNKVFSYRYLISIDNKMEHPSVILEKILNKNGQYKFYTTVKDIVSSYG